ncbi:MAG: hypothetical protein EB141_19445 [Verrucomicrobia bacterium]|nr:hypothetical protein [Verrucomicrobiota bacterium]
MNELPVVLSAVLPVLLIAVAGVALRKLDWLTEEADHSLLRVTINLLVPAFIFDKVLGNPALHRTENLFLPPLVGFVTVALGIGASWLALRLAGLGRDATGRTFAFSSGLYNYGYVPLPLAISLFNRETVGVLIVHNLGTEIAFWLLGTIVFAHAANEPLWKKILSPPLIAIVATLTMSPRIGALTLAAGLALLSLLAHLTRAIRSPWRSSRADVGTLAALALGMAILAVVLP